MDLTPWKHTNDIRELGKSSLSKPKSTVTKKWMKDPLMLKPFVKRESNVNINEKSNNNTLSNEKK